MFFNTKKTKVDVETGYKQPKGIDNLSSLQLIDKSHEI